MQIFKTITKIQNYLNKQNKTIALIPTMGGIHQGHLSLIKTAKQHAELIIVSIFINPTQFEKNEDFDDYPRMLENDLQQLKTQKTDIVFIPDVDEIYPPNYVFNYQIGRLNKILCSISRPIFFAGVTKVVYRLFDIIKPNIAVFGEKDYQQLLIIKKMVKDLELNIKIISSKTYREKSGLAISTRNKYLTKKEKIIASEINDILTKAIIDIKNKKQINNILINTKQELTKKFTLDYCEILDAKTLGKIEKATSEIIILTAVKLGKTRLIDNKRIKNV